MDSNLTGIAQVAIGIAQVITAAILTYYTYWLWRSTNSYAQQAKTQTDIMQKNAELQKKQMDINNRELDQNISLLRYHRLKDEMDKLIAPLYFASLSANIEQGKMGWFELIPPAKRYFPQHKRVSDFWDEIKRNLYLSRNEEILQELMTHFKTYEEYWKDNQSQASRNYYISQLKRLDIKIKERYPALKKQIEQTEIELGVNIIPLREEVKIKAVLDPKNNE